MCVGSIGAGSEELKIRRASIVQFTAALPPPLRRLPSCPTVYYAWQGTRQGVIALILEVYDVSSSAAAVLLGCFFSKQNKKTEDTQQRSFIIELETIKKGTQKSAPPARALFKHS